MWQSISLQELLEVINETEHLLSPELLRFWQLIKVEPVKWEEKQYGSEGSGFWVIAICGTKTIWYNDIEEGFNVSPYINYGEISEYCCNQLDFNHAIYQLYYSTYVASSPPKSV